MKAVKVQIIPFLTISIKSHQINDIPYSLLCTVKYTSPFRDDINSYKGVGK